MRPLEFYRLGLRLAESADTEVKRRTAVSRMCYGLHHEACCRYFRENPDDPPLARNGRHTALIQRFRDKPRSIERDIASMLDHIRQMRNVCDYELDSRIQFRQLTIDSEQLVGMALIVANDLLGALEDFSPGEALDGCDCSTT